jgi:hypothetical protein
MIRQIFPSSSTLGEPALGEPALGEPALGEQEVLTKFLVENSW